MKIEMKEKMKINEFTTFNSDNILLLILKIVLVLVDFQDKIYSITTSLYTKYSIWNSYLEMETVSKSFWFWVIVRCGSHRGGSSQNGLGDERTCGMTLASAYVLRHLSAMWSQLQMKERKSEIKVSTDLVCHH